MQRLTLALATVGALLALIAAPAPAPAQPPTRDEKTGEINVPTLPPGWELDCQTVMVCDPGTTPGTAQNCKIKQLCRPVPPPPPPPPPPTTVVTP